MPFELNSSDAGKLLAHFEGRRGEVLSLVRALCEAESPSGDADGSRAVVNLLSDAARALRPVASVERVAAQNDYGEHLLLRAFTEGATDETRATLLLGHTDTVHPRGTLAERPWRETEGRIHAPGIFDMKANCAVALEALRACDATGLGPRRPVTLLLTCDEESGSFSGRELVEAESRRAECVLVLEPPAPGGRVKTARKGTGLFNLQVEGCAAHAGLEPEKGVSAVHEIARQIGRASSLARPEVGTTINVGTVNGGTHANVVAASARAEIDVRFNTADEARRIESALRGLKPFDERARVSVSGGINRPPLERTKAVAELFERARRVASAFDFLLCGASGGGGSGGKIPGGCRAALLGGPRVRSGRRPAPDRHPLRRPP